MGLIKRLTNWNRNRREEKRKINEEIYQGIIGRYSPEEQEFIHKGRNVDIYYFVKQRELIETIKKIHPKVIGFEALTGPWTFKGPLGTRKYAHKPVTYCRASHFREDHEVNVGYWLEIGKLGADALGPAGICGGDWSPQYVEGIPIKYLK